MGEFTGTPDTWQLTTCTVCGVDAHYRFITIVGDGESPLSAPACDACRLRENVARNRPEWKGHVLALLAEHPVEVVASRFTDPEIRAFVESGWRSRAQIEQQLAECGFDLVSIPAPVVGFDDPLVACCRNCGRLGTARMGDLAWGCSCSRNQRSVRTGTVLLFGSEDPCLQWWDHERNTEADAATVTLRARRSVWWVGPECGHRFCAPVRVMATRPDCPTCRDEAREHRKAEHAALALLTVAQVPELAQAWADDEDPATVSAADMWLYRFRCPQGHHPRMAPRTYLHNGCQFCRGAHRQGTRPTLAEAQPEVASQWHPTRNGDLTASDVGPFSRRQVWWLADCCGHEWRQRVVERDKYHRWRCPACRSLLDSLAWHRPELAAEWSADNPVDAWHVRPSAATPFLPLWVCATDPAHVWQASVASRSSGSGCPECRVAGKSAVELAHFQAARELFGSARSGLRLHDDTFTGTGSWAVDIAVEVDGGLLIIEYDGAYWHSGPGDEDLDARKTRDLLRAGYLVVRLREDGLAPLPIEDRGYHEIRVYSAAPRPGEVMAQVQHWVAARG